MSNLNDQTGCEDQRPKIRDPRPKIKDQPYLHEQIVGGHLIALEEYALQLLALERNK